MNILNAIVKTSLKFLSNNKYEKDLKKSKIIAYNNVNKKIKNAKFNNFYINASSKYKKEYFSLCKKAQENKKLRNDFISYL